MTLDTLFAELAARGLTVALDGDRPTLRGPKSAVTPAVLAALRQRRPEIIERLRPKPRWEYLWTTGYRQWHDGPDARPVGAWWRREEGAAEWQPVPDTPGIVRLRPEVA